MFDVLSGQYKNLASKGRYGDTMLAHINPQEAGLLKAMGGAGTINPRTGLREFYGLNQFGNVPQFTPEPPPSLGQVLNPNDLNDVPKQLNTITIPAASVGGMGGTRPAYDKISDDYLQYADRAPATGMGGGRQIEGYTLPTDKEIQGKKLSAKYDAKGNFQYLTMTGDQFLTPDTSQPNILSQPKINAKGELIDAGVFDINQQDDGGFFGFLGDVVSEFAPMIIAGLTGNYLASSGLLGTGAGAAGATGGTLAGMGTGAAGAAATAAATGIPITALTAGGATTTGLAGGAGTSGGLSGVGTGAAGVNATTAATGLSAETLGTGTLGGATTTGVTTGGATTGTTTGTTTGATTGTTTGATTTGATTTAADAAATVAGNADKAAIFGAGGYGAPATAAELAAATSTLSSLGDAGSSLLKFIKENPSISGSVLGSIVSAVGAANAPKSQTTTTSVDPDIKKEYLYNLQTAKEVAAGLKPRTFQDFTSDYQLASQQVKDLGLGGIGQQTTNKAAELALLEAGFTPQQIAAANAGNASLANATGYTAAQIAAAQANRANVANVASGAGAQYMSAYQNPYEQQVVQGALSDIERSRLMQEQANMAKATAAKAFGGSRQGVVSGMTNEAALREAANTAAQLRSAGFTQAAQLGQTDAARALQAQLANQGIDVTLEQANAQLSQQGLLSNQAATNQASQFSAGATNQANLSNAAALNQMAQYNANLQQQAALANQSAYAQGAMIRQGAIGQLGQLGAQQQNLGLAGANAVMEDQIRQQALAQARLDATRNLGVERLGITSGALGLQPANLGGTTSQPLYNNTAGSLLSGGLTGAYIGSLLGRG